MNDRTQAVARKSKEEKLPRGVRRRGNSLIIYLTFPDGHIERRSLGRVTVKFAQSQRTVYMREIAEGRYLRKAVKVPRLTFTEIADACYERAKAVKQHWHSDFSRINLLKSWWGERFADELATKEIEAKLREQKWSEATFNEYRVTLIGIYKLAQESAADENRQARAVGSDPVKQELLINPALRVPRFKLNNARTRELSAAEEERLREAIIENYPSKLPEFELTLNTGMRRSNIYGSMGGMRRSKPALMWDDVNLDFRVITLKWSKSGAGYAIPLNSVALAALKTLRERCPDGKVQGPVIRRKSGLEVNSCRRWFESCLTKAGIENFVYHDLRHTFATRLRRNGISVEDIAALLGHNLNRITLRYAHADLTKLAAAVETLVPKTKTGTKTDTPPVLAFPQVAM